MGVLITSADFTGYYAIPSGAFTDLDDFIDKTEEDYLSDLLGADLYASFKADLTDKVPVTQKYLNIYNSFRKDYGSKVYRSNGMKIMLLGFIFFDYMRQVKYKATTEGMVYNSPDTSKDTQIANLYSYLNLATDTFNSIQTFITSISASDYYGAGLPVYNGQEKTISISILG